MIDGSEDNAIRKPPLFIIMHGCYINLAESTARREAMEAQLQRLGLDSWVRRFDAIDAKALDPSRTSVLSRGELACFLSHTEAIAGANPDGFLLVMEDDALLSDALPAVLQSGALSQLDGCDIAFLECQPYTSTGNLLALWSSLRRRLPPRGSDAPRHQISGIDFLDARSLYNWGAVAYLVTPRGLRTLPGLLREALSEGPVRPYDMTLNHLVHSGRIQGTVLSPFLATPALHSHAGSTIGNRPDAVENDVLGGALRRLFFAGPVDELDGYVAACRHAPLTDDDQLRLLADLMAQLFVITARQEH
jgi:GR25 family glycosyltransferase involved in LPS biosynthesis